MNNPFPAQVWTFKIFQLRYSSPKNFSPLSTKNPLQTYHIPLPQRRIIHVPATNYEHLFSAPIRIPRRPPSHISRYTRTTQSHHHHDQHHHQIKQTNMQLPSSSLLPTLLLLTFTLAHPQNPTCSPNRTADLYLKDPSIIGPSPTGGKKYTGSLPTLNPRVKLIKVRGADEEEEDENSSSNIGPEVLLIEREE